MLQKNSAKQSNLLLRIQSMSTPQLLDYINAFVSYLANQRRLSSHTVLGYLYDIKLLLNFLLGNLSNSADNFDNGAKVSLQTLQELDIGCFRAWLANMVQNGRTHTSNARTLSAIKGFFNFLQDKNAITSNFTVQVKKPKLPKVLPKVASEVEVQKLIDAASAISTIRWQQLRDKALVVLLVTSGLRISEALGIKKADISSNINALHITLHITGKGDKQRLVPLVETAQYTLQQYLEDLPYKSQYVFVGNSGKVYTSRMAQALFKQIRIKANLQDFITPHAMRHTFATLLLSNTTNGDSLKKIQDLLGHQNLATTQIYTKINQQKLQSSLQQAGYWSDKNTNNISN